MPTLTTDNPIVVFLVALLILLLGLGSGGFIRGVMADRNKKRVDDAALLDQVRELVREEMRHMAGRLREAREELAATQEEAKEANRRQARLERRVNQLTETLRQNGIAVPAWLASDDRDEPNPTT